ncbi:MAG: 16S rRNA (adenine(1518)-N(6)/adenine(1519)-N(6))-dimethyltransferase RsmA [Anaerolineae bacterium]|nr:16S rRNA (adenine(1518)-N(6)/adenine(1519)-N(6))-dimethyltransferase RsmA [Anaerolineae bacterium]
MNDRQLLDHHAISPKKSLGQNFLHDPHTLEKIVASAALAPGATVLEIGPGTGNLTHLLAQRAARVIAVEVDDRLIPLLTERFADQAHVEIVHADILAVDIAALVERAPYSVVANLPYYITSAILRVLLEAPHKPERLVITVQREVAERLVATPGAMSLLAVSVQFYGQPQIVARLNAGVFWPRPDVESAVVRIDVYRTPPVAVPDEQLFFRVVRAGFGQKRKQLRNALSAGLHIDKERTADLLGSAGIDPQRRAETLSLEEWAALTRAAAGAGL